MNFQSLQDLYENNPQIKQLNAALSLKNLLRIELNGLRGSSINFIAGSAWKNLSANHVFVLNDQEEASYFQNDLEQITQALDIFLFPDSFKKPGAYHDLNSSHVMLRTEALSKIDSESQKKVLVTYPEALMEKVVNATALSKNRISIKIGETLKIQEILERLVSLGFQREDFVYEPGQFAMRGDILDIYSFGNEHPYRIELFGNEVDSIRIFNPETQLSERKLLHVSILPNIETNFETEQKISLLEYLPENTIFWFKDFKFCLDKLEKIEAELPEKINDGKTISVDHEEQWLKELSTSDFEQISTWKERLTHHHIIEWNDHANLIKTNFKKDQQEIIENKISFHNEPQPSFNRNFSLLIADLEKRKQ